MLLQRQATALCDRSPRCEPAIRSRRLVSGQYVVTIAKVLLVFPLPPDMAQASGVWSLWLPSKYKSYKPNLGLVLLFNSCQELAITADAVHDKIASISHWQKGNRNLKKHDIALSAMKGTLILYINIAYVDGVNPLSASRFPPTSSSLFEAFDILSNLFCLVNVRPMPTTFDDNAMVLVSNSITYKAHPRTFSVPLQTFSLPATAFSCLHHQDFRSIACMAVALCDGAQNIIQPLSIPSDITLT